MNLSDYTHLINKPDAINERHSEALEKIIKEFSYFQSARVLRLKHLYNQDSFKYNYALKVTAAYTTDRSVLFDFITSDNFITVQNGLYEKKIAELFNIDVIDSEVIEVQKPKEIIQSAIEKSILSSINVKKSIEEKLEIGKPLEFSTSETHSFQEWLQLSRLKPIDRSKNKKSLSEEELEKKKQQEIIDKFIENNPKISPASKEIKTPVFEPVFEDKSYLMTETLARVYLEQKKYSKAIQAYEILILKYPEKISFFANRIAEIKELQNNN